MGDHEKQGNVESRLNEALKQVKLANLQLILALTNCILLFSECLHINSSSKSLELLEAYIDNIDELRKLDALVAYVDDLDNIQQTLRDMHASLETGNYPLGLRNKLAPQITTLAQKVSAHFGV